MDTRKVAKGAGGEKQECQPGRIQRDAGRGLGNSFKKESNPMFWIAHSERKEAEGEQEGRQEEKGEPNDAVKEDSKEGYESHEDDDRQGTQEVDQ